MLAACGLMIAAAGGIGGGGILVPIYILVLRFSPKYAVPLSNITIFGGAITNTFLNMKKRHPLADRPLVDWDLILVMEPLTSELSIFQRCGCLRWFGGHDLERSVPLDRCTGCAVSHPKVLPSLSLTLMPGSAFAPGSSTTGLNLWF